MTGQRERFEAYARENYDIYSTFACWQAAEAQQQARIDELERFARDVATNYDCDSDAHKYGTTCRACKAQEILAAGGEVKP